MEIGMLRITLPGGTDDSLPMLDMKLQGRSSQNKQLPPVHINTKIYMDLNEVLDTAKMLKNLQK